MTKICSAFHIKNYCKTKKVVLYMACYWTRKKNNTCFKLCVEERERGGGVGAVSKKNPVTFSSSSFRINLKLV